jgi:hypothetical protein
MPLGISPILTATTTPTPDTTAVAEATYQAMLDINKTQNAAYFATSAAMQTARPPTATPTRRRQQMKFRGYWITMQILGRVWMRSIKLLILFWRGT